MSNKIERILRLACIVIAALLVLQLVRFGFRKNSLDDVKIPAVPTLSTNAPAKAEGKSGTNTVAQPEKKPTEIASSKTGEKPTNAVDKVAATNAVVATATNAAATSTNIVAGTTATNVVASEKATNVLAGAPSLAKGTNQVSATNAPSVASAKEGGKPMSMPPGMPGPGGPGGPSNSGKKGGDLPPEVQARIDKIIKSELLAPVIKPLPMALFGIAGNSVFLRAPSGQSGVIKEGEELGGVKILKIGFNRVLVQQDGEKKELTVFSGMGGETLLTNETKELSK